VVAVSSPNIYADPRALPGADGIAEAIDASIDELLRSEAFVAPPATPILD
jgi:hypothetical protein